MAQLTIAEIVKQVAIDVGLEEPTGTITTSTDKDIKQILQFSLGIGRELRNKYYWPQLKKEGTITTSNGVNQYALPGDYWQMISGTQWDQTNSFRMKGPLSDSEWTTFQHGIVSSTSRKRFRVSGANTDSGRFFIDPTPSAAETLSFEYLRKQWIFPVAWVTSTGYTSGDIVSANGNLYSAGSTATSGATRPSGTTTSSDGTITWTYVPTQLYGDSNQRWQADTDFPLLDDDLIIMGVVWKYLKRKGFDYQEEKAIYEKECRDRLTRLEGAPILNTAETGLTHFLSYDNIPESGF